MKKSFNRLITITSLAIGFSLATTLGHATTIYFDDFSGSSGSNLNGTTPDVTIGANTWTADSVWKANGTTVTGTSDASAFLPFSPVAGNVYTLSATLAQPSGTNSSQWAAIGFTSTSTTTGSFYNNSLAPGGDPWVLYRSVASSSSTVSSFTGPGTGGSDTEGNFSGPRTLSIELNTTAAQWTARWFVGATLVRTHNYSSNPTISFVGLGREDQAPVDFSAFSLTDAIEIAVSGNSVDIADGDATPSLTDFTDFGSTTVGSPIQRVFRVANTGTVALTTSGLTLPSGFSLIEPLSSSIPGNSFDTFTVQLDAFAAGTYGGQILFNNNDFDENAFNFSITGTVAVLVPEPGSVALAGIGILAIVGLMLRRSETGVSDVAFG